MDSAPATGGDFPAGLRRVAYESPRDGLRDWALYRPGRVRDLWVVVLHGHGAQGDQIFTRADLRETWLPVFVASGLGLVTPNLRGNAWMGPDAAADLHDLIGWLRADCGLRKAILCSGSMGGTGNLIYGALHPEDVAGIVARGAATDLASYHDWCVARDRPLLQEIARAIRSSYSGTPDECAGIYARHSALRHAARLTMPVRLSHGEADAVIPVDQARALAGRLRAAGTFAYREIPGGNHDAPLRETADFGAILRAVASGDEQEEKT